MTSSSSAFTIILFLWPSFSARENDADEWERVLLLHAAGPKVGLKAPAAGE